MMKLQIKQQQVLFGRLFSTYNKRQFILMNQAFFPSKSIYSIQKRFFALPKYSFDDEEWDANKYQVSRVTHKSNAEELINSLPIVEVDGDTARCLGVNELGLGHPVQYIQLNTRYEESPTTCKWCGLRFKKRAGSHGHH